MRNPVCGYSNGKQYDNKCELHKEECTTGQVIGVMQGPCKSKYYNFMSIIEFNLNVSEFMQQYGKTFVCDKHGRVITCVLCRDLHLN